MAISLVTIATATLILFLDVFLSSRIEKEVGLYICLVFLSAVSVHYVCFSDKL